MCGTPQYMSPEMVKPKEYDAAADRWALGVLGVEMLSGATPFDNENGDEWIKHGIENDKPTMPENISKDMKEFLTKLLHKDPLQRLGIHLMSYYRSVMDSLTLNINFSVGGGKPSAAPLKEHKLFKDIDWEKVDRKELAPPCIIPPSEKLPNSFKTFRGTLNESLKFKCLNG